MRNIICQLLKRKKRSIIPPVIVPPTGVNNQLKEIEYFDAYVLPLAEKSNLQTAIDTYGAVRLEKGDYSGVNVVMYSNQRLYGHPSTNNITSITIAAGSTNVRLESLKPAPNSGLPVTFQTGSVISNCIFKTLKYAQITATGAMLENNTFIDMQNSNISFDSSVSGYARNNRIIKHQAHGVSNIMILKGNDITPSYGNVSMHVNFLGSSGETSDFDTLQSTTLIGVDAETYGGLTRELIHVNNVDKLNLFILNGGISYNSGFGFSDIDAGEVYGVTMNGGSDYPSKLSTRTNLLNFSSNTILERNVGTVTGYLAKYYLEQIDRDYFPHFEYDGVDQTSTITNPTTITKLTNNILGTEYTPWTRPTWETIPDPLGVNWQTERIGKTDSTSYIQNLINTNGVAELPEGVFYISSTLNIPIGAGKGIVGKGTGKTVICGLRDDFPLLSVTSGTFGDIVLGYLTLQGGSTGLYVSNTAMMMSFASMSFVSFRNQASGIHFYNILGLDNNFFDNVSFTNCEIGIKGEPLDAPFNPSVLEGWTYLDKNVFNHCQFNNCNKSMELYSSRASNLNAWVDCKFDGGNMAVDMRGETTIFANCDFTNFTGDYALKSTNLNLINCNFYNNTNAKSTIYSILNNIEGCNFLDNIPLGSPIDGNPVQNFISNSTITGNAVVVPDEIAWRPTYTTYVNNNLLSNPTFNGLLVLGVSNTPTVILNAEPNPYPQFLVTQ